MAMIGLSFTADLLGWLLAFLLPAIALAGPLRRDRGAAQAYLFTALLHVAAAAVYVYLPGILPGRGDTHAFHRYAVLQQSAAEWSFGIGSQFYKECLAIIYSLIGPSFFLGAIISIYAFAFSVLVLIKFMELLNIKRGKGLAVLLFGALPTAVLYGTVPMREPYQVLFFMLACYGLLRFRFTNNPLHLIAAIIFALLMGLLHKGLIIYAPLLIMIMLFVRVDHALSHPRSAARSTHLHRLLAAVFAIAIVAVVPPVVQQMGDVGGTDVLTALTDDGLIDYAAGHRDEEALNKGRTAYGVALDTSSLFSLIYTLLMVFFYYMFTPFPWQVKNFLDFYAFGEVILRILFFIFIFRMWLNSNPIRRHIVIALMIVYASMALIWAAGTTNYGTATRHHMVHQWILLLLGVPALVYTVPVAVRNRRGVRDTEALRCSEQHGTSSGPGTPHLRTLTQTPLRPRRLEAEAYQTRYLQMTNATPRVASRGLRRVRRLTWA